MITKEKSKMSQNNNPEFNNKHPRISDGTFTSNGQRTFVSYAKTGTNNIYREKKSYHGPIEPNENAKQIYSKVFGEKYSSDFFLSQNRVDHFMSEHQELDFDDVIYCINNPNVITKTKANEQVNIISLLPNGNYAYILVDVKLNNKSDKKYNKNGILSARYLRKKTFKKEINRHEILFTNIDINQK